MIQLQSALRHHLLKIAIAERITQIPPHAQPDDLVAEMSATKQRRSAHPHLRSINITARHLPACDSTNQVKLIGILYLENNLTPHVFTPDRVTVLNVLASPAAMPLENMRLYRRDEKKNCEHPLNGWTRCIFLLLPCCMQEG